MDIGKAFGFVFEDEKWITKVLIGGLLIWIPIINFAVFGYMLKVAENVARGNSQVLPEWSEFGDLFMRGLYYFLITLVYQIPTIIFGCVFGGLVGVLGSNIDPDTGQGAGGLVALAGCFYPLIFVIALVLGLGAYAATARYIATGIFSEAFKFGEVFASLRANIGTWIILILVSLLAGFVANLASSPAASVHCSPIFMPTV